MRVNITAWCTYQEYYSLEITEDYLKHLNEWIHERYSEIEFEDINLDDVYSIFSNYEQNDKLNLRLDEWYTLGGYVEEYIREDVWDRYEGNEYCGTDDSDTKIEFDSYDEKVRFEGEEE